VEAFRTRSEVNGREQEVAVRMVGDAGCCPRIRVQICAGSCSELAVVGMVETTYGSKMCPPVHRGHYETCTRAYNPRPLDQLVSTLDEDPSSPRSAKFTYTLHARLSIGPYREATDVGMSLWV
jgi:hypothetical protein